MFRANTPQLYVDIDRSKCKTMGVELSDVFNALQVQLEQLLRQRFQPLRPHLAGDRPGRRAIIACRPADVERLKVRNDDGDMVPLGAVAAVKDIAGPVMINRYNTYPAAADQRRLVAGHQFRPGHRKDGEAGRARICLRLQDRVDRTDASCRILAGNTALLIFPLCVLLVFLTHAAEYESFSLPLAIVLIVPMSLLCALVGVWLCGMDNNLFTQIGFVVLAGLACKNAVLIVEFAKQQREHGLSIHDAVVEASRLRLRPIIMTSFAFILGVVPLMLATGAGAEMRQHARHRRLQRHVGRHLLRLLPHPHFL